MRPATPRLPYLRLLWAAPLCLLLAGCGLPDFMRQPPQSRGNRVDADALAQLVPGTSTRADAMALFGTPSAKAAFDDNTWIYISGTTKPVIAATNEVTDQRVVVLRFDERGTLRGVESRGDADVVPVTMVARATPSPGTEASFLQQLLGNIGRFSPTSSPHATGPSSGTGAGRGVSGNS